MRGLKGDMGDEVEDEEDGGELGDDGRGERAPGPIGDADMAALEKYPAIAIRVARKAEEGCI